MRILAFTLPAAPVRAPARAAMPGRAAIAAVALSLAMAVSGPWAATPGRAGEWRSWCGAPGSGDPGSGASLGWHFYCDRQDGNDDPAAPKSEPSPAAEPESSAKERILAMRRALEEARAEAILEPTAENVAAYLRLQQETLQRAAVFSDAFRRTVWATPALDYTLRRPVGALAKQVWSDGRREAREAALARLGERYGLIYLGHAGCAACKVFGPLLRAFALRHGLDVLAVSLTGEPLEGWPEAVSDNGRAAQLGLSGAPVPALVLFDAETKRAVPVGFGVMAEDEMAGRIFALTQLESGHDY